MDAPGKSSLGGVTSDLLRRALEDPGDPRVPPLPSQARELLETLDAPPRLAAHLRAVHDVAGILAGWVRQHYPGVRFDAAAVVFGAAIHDIGKVVHVGELSGPGSAHEQAGYELLLAQGVEEAYARFARTHALWDAEDVGVEDLLVSLADKAWKAKRVPELEKRVTDVLAAASGEPSWQVFMSLDDLLDRIAAGADGRLAFQSAYPV